MESENVTVSAQKRFGIDAGERNFSLTANPRPVSVQPMPKRSKMPPEANELAVMIVDMLEGMAPPAPPDTRNPAAVQWGRMGGLLGGPARAKKLNKSQRIQIAKIASAARHRKRTDGAGGR